MKIAEIPESRQRCFWNQLQNVSPQVSRKCCEWADVGSASSSVNSLQMSSSRHHHFNILVKKKKKKMMMMAALWCILNKWQSCIHPSIHPSMNVFGLWELPPPAPRPAPLRLSYSTWPLLVFGTLALYRMCGELIVPWRGRFAGWRVRERTYRTLAKHNELRLYSR